MTLALPGKDIRVLTIFFSKRDMLQVMHVSSCHGKNNTHIFSDENEFQILQHNSVSNKTSTVTLVNDTVFVSVLFGMLLLKNVNAMS